MMKIDPNNAAMFCLSTEMFGEYLHPKLRTNPIVRNCFEASKMMGHKEEAALRFMAIHLVEAYESLYAEMLKREMERPAPPFIIAK